MWKEDQIAENVAAFVLRIAPGGADHTSTALETNTIIIGWSLASGLMDKTLNEAAFRQVLVDAYNDEDMDYANNPRGASSAAGNMWRFIREMKVDDLVVVPHGSNFYLARIKGEVEYRRDRVKEDTAFRRHVEWLNNKKPIPRDQAPSALYSRMKVRQTVARATDLRPEIESVLALAQTGSPSDFAEQLSESLSEVALKQLQKGQMNERDFEKIVALVLQRLGAQTTITPRSVDKGDDIVAFFKHIGSRSLLRSNIIAIPVGKRMLPQFIKW